jgi:hypothetical protein
LRGPVEPKQHARDRIREMTDRRWLWRPVEDTVHELNQFGAAGRATSVTETPLIALTR